MMSMHINVPSVYAGVLGLILLSLLFYEGKFYRLSGPCHSNWIHPKHQQVELHGNELICCPDDFFQLGSVRPCYSGMHQLHFLSSFMGAWLLPLVVPVSWWVQDLVLKYNNASGQSNDDHARDSTRQSHLHLQRIGQYIGLMVYRSFVIYPIFNSIEDFLGLWGHTPPVLCSFGHLRQGGRCPTTTFDHADHVVLFLVHYLLISTIEWNYTCTLLRGRDQRRFNDATTGGVSFRQVYLILLNLTVVYSLFQTLTSFHSITESLVAWVIATAFVLVPYLTFVQESVHRRR